MSATHEDETRGDVIADERDSREVEEEVNRILHEEILKGEGTPAEKQAAFLQAVAAAAEKSAKGFLMSLEDGDMRNALCGRPLAQDQNDPGADAAAAALAASVSRAATDHAGRAPFDAGAPGLDETAGRVLRAAWAGKITPKEAVSLLMELGLPEATIRTLMADRDE